MVAFPNASKNLQQFCSLLLLLLLLLHLQIRMLMKISRGGSSSSSCSNNSKMGEIIIINQGCQSMDFSGGGGGGANKQWTPVLCNHNNSNYLLLGFVFLCFLSFSLSLTFLHVCCSICY